MLIGIPLQELKYSLLNNNHHNVKQLIIHKRNLRKYGTWLEYKTKLNDAIQDLKTVLGSWTVKKKHCCLRHSRHHSNYKTLKQSFAQELSRWTHCDSDQFKALLQRMKDRYVTGERSMQNSSVWPKLVTLNNVNVSTIEFKCEKVPALWTYPMIYWSWPLTFCYQKYLDHFYQNSKEFRPQFCWLFCLLKLNLDAFFVYLKVSDRNKEKVRDGKNEKGKYHHVVLTNRCTD